MITTTTDGSMKYGNSNECKCNTIRTNFSWVYRGRDRMVVLIVLHLYSLLLPYFLLQFVVVMIVR
jgi:hypothetical protein